MTYSKNGMLSAIMLLSIFSCKDNGSTFDCVEVKQDSIDAIPMKYTYVSHYGVWDRFHGDTTANGEIMDYRKFTAARKRNISNRKLPYGSIVRIYNIKDTTNYVDVRINDCWKLTNKRWFDLSYAAFDYLFDPDQWEVKVWYKVIYKPIKK